MTNRSHTMLAMLAIALVNTAVHAQSLCGQWTTLIEDLAGPLSPSAGVRVSEMAVFDAGDGPMLYVVGNFTTITDAAGNEVRAPAIARFDGTTWSALPGLGTPELQADGRAMTLEVYDDGAGEALYIGGAFTTIAGLPANGIARWDGANWSTLGSPPLPGLTARILDIHCHDFGDGEHLYVAGEFADALTGQAGVSVYRWDGRGWSPAGVNTPNSGAAYRLASFDGELFATGQFLYLGDTFGSGFARFDGETWSVPQGPHQELLAIRGWPLHQTTLEGRPVLAAGGLFTLKEFGQIVAQNGILFWDGQRWHAATPFPPGAPSQTYALESFNSGQGEALFVSGYAGVERLLAGRSTRIATIDSDVFDLHAFDDGTGEALYAAGRFATSTTREAYLARWIGQPLCVADRNHDCTLDLFDFMSFQIQFSRGDQSADLDRDGALTIFDFLAFQTDFDAGCP
jgi:hypothetical protein